MSVVLDRRAAEQVGRHARLELVFAARHGRTILAHSYAEPPFRTGRWFPEGNSLHMIMASSSPGIFGGDVLEQSIVVEEGASVRLTSQSAPQLHASPDGATAIVRAAYRVAAGAHLSCHWDALIPFAGSSLDQRIAVEVAESSRLYWSDAMMNGRVARQEHWRFASLAHELGISRAGELAYLERFRITPGSQSPSQPWVAADAAFLGTALAIDPSGTAAGDAARVQDLLGTLSGATGAADALDESIVVVRLMDALGVRFHAARALVRKVFCSR